MLPPAPDAADLVARVLRADAIVAAAPEDPDALPSLEALDANADALEEAVAALDTAIAALPAGRRASPTDTLPADAARSPAARAALAATPERFTRAALEARAEAARRRRDRALRACGKRRAPDFHARNAALWDGVVEALGTPDTPEIKAAREAREAEEEARKVRLLNEFHAQRRAAPAEVAWRRVLAEPGSFAAREALLAAWSGRTDAATRILADQLALLRHRREGSLGSDTAQATWRRQNLTVGREGHIAAGRVLAITPRFRFHRGLVAEVELSGERFVRNAAALVAAAPIQHLVLTAPLGPLDALFAVPELARMGSLTIHGLGAAFGDAGARALAASPLAANLRWIALTDCAIGVAGVAALAASPHLGELRYLALGGNPADATPTATVHEGVAHTGRPALAAALEASFGPRPWLAEPADPEDWPPDRDRLVTTD